MENFRGGINWYMMSSKDFIPKENSKIRIENGDLVSFNGQYINFRLSNKESWKVNNLSFLKNEHKN